MQEKWKDVKGFEGIYMVSNKGNIKSLARFVESSSPCGGRNIKERILKAQIDDGYYKVTLAKDGKDYRRRVHRLVAEAFSYNDDPVNKTTVNHIDKDKLNNDASNLEWCTPEYNLQYSSYDGRFKVPVRCKTTNTEFDSIKEACEYYGISYSTGIIRCCRGTQKYCGSFDGQKLEWECLVELRKPQLVLCINDGKVFDSCAEAARFYNISPKGINRVCKGKRHTHKGYAFKYVDRE